LEVEGVVLTEVRVGHLVEALAVHSSLVVGQTEAPAALLWEVEAVVGRSEAQERREEVAPPEVRGFGLALYHCRMNPA
jgi:hypothetical protein